MTLCLVIEHEGYGYGEWVRVPTAYREDDTANALEGVINDILTRVSNGREYWVAGEGEWGVEGETYIASSDITIDNFAYVDIYEVCTSDCAERLGLTESALLEVSDGWALEKCTEHYPEPVREFTARCATSRDLEAICDERARVGASIRRIDY